jgi:hypothetical protein
MASGNDGLLDRVRHAVLQHRLARSAASALDVSIQAQIINLLKNKLLMATDGRGRRDRRASRCHRQPRRDGGACRRTAHPGASDQSLNERAEPHIIVVVGASGSWQIKPIPLLLSELTGAIADERGIVAEIHQHWHITTPDMRPVLALVALPMTLRLDDEVAGLAAEGLCGFGKGKHFNFHFGKGY